MKYYAKDYEGFVAVCDSDILGKKFEEEECVLDVSEKFFKGELINEDDIKLLFMEELNFILFGNNIVKIAEEMGLVLEKEVKEIKGVKHAQVYCIRGE